MLRQARRTPAVVRTTVVLAAALALSACQGGPDSSQAPTTSPSASASSASSASPSPTSKSPEDKAVKQAKQVVRDYYRVKDLSLQDPDAFVLEDYKTVAISSALVDLQNLYNAAKMQGHQIGRTTVDSFEVLDVDLTNKPKQSEIPTVQLSVCYDVSKLNIVDKEGKSIVPPDRKDRGIARIGVSNFEYPEGPWLVGFVEYPENKTC